MGVRFQCPNGHKLHVKAELAGKRGVCPECKARFIVPSFSGGRAAEADAVSMPRPGSSPVATTPTSSAGVPTAATQSKPSGDPAASSIVIKTEPQARPQSTSTPSPVATPQPGAAPVAQPLSAPPLIGRPVATHAGAETARLATAPPSEEPVVWYLRPSTGGQFGPATEDGFRQWIVDGRVAADSWVWRTGWPDWKAGGEVLPLFAERPPQEPAAAMAALDMPTIVDAAATTAAAHVDPGSAEARRREIKRRKQRVRTVSAVLALVALVMLTLLVIVLVR